MSDDKPMTDADLQAIEALVNQWATCTCARIPHIEDCPRAQIPVEILDALASGRALLAEARRLRAQNTELHRRVQKAEGLLARCEAPQKARKRGSGSLGRAAANYAAVQAERERDEARAELAPLRARVAAVEKERDDGLALRHQAYARMDACLTERDEARAQRDAWREFAVAQTAHHRSVSRGDVGADYVRHADAAGVAWLKVQEIDPEGAARMPTP